MRGTQRLFPGILLPLGLNPFQHILLALLIQSANKSGYSFSIQTQTSRRDLQLAEPVNKMKNRHFLATRKSPLPDNQAMGLLRSQSESLIAKGVHIVRQAGTDFSDVFLNGLGKTE